jgi:NAD-dependent dihydropyrimidine dehydrogenase PreA subunit
LPEEKNIRMIVVCTCSFRRLLSENAIRKAVAALALSGKEYTMVDDLCRMSACEKDALAAMAGYTVVACHPRAVKALFDAAGSKAGKIFNIRTEPVDDILNQMELTRSGDHAAVELPSPKGEWQPWFPAIDRDRCTSCRKCMDYCLFGVYSWDGANVRVTRPANCKDNCPACARVCPAKAVIFPKYTKSPINGGLTDDDDAVDINMRELYKNGLYTKLAARNRNTSRLTDDDF